MQEPRQNESVKCLAATPLRDPNNRDTSILRCLAIAAIACFFALPNQLAAQAKKTWTGDWAGYILYASNQVPLVPPAAPFTIIEAEWVVPNASPTIDCSNPLEPKDGSSIWIGLDGWSSTYHDSPAKGGGADTDILQAGTETDVDCYGTLNPPPANAYFWIEWDGTANVPVTPGHVTVAVPVGDLVHVRITVDTTTWQDATVYFEDKSPGGQTYTTTFHSGCLYSYCSSPVVDATLFGNTAEWVVESTFYADKKHPHLPNTLDNFSTTQITNMSVTDINGIVYNPGNPGNNTNPQLDWMSWTSYGNIGATGNALMACAAVTDAQTITLSRAPFTIGPPGQQGALEPKPLNCDGTPPP